MKIHEIKERTPNLLAKLLEIWERSVRETHLFLTDKEVIRIKGYVPQAMLNVAHLLIAENKDGEPVAFMGIENSRLEMLFIAPEYRGKGLGKQLTEYGIKNLNVHEVTVNEQNPQAVGFYRHLGVETYKRSDTDEDGNPYPLLYLKLNQ